MTIPWFIELTQMDYYQFMFPKLVMASSIMIIIVIINQTQDDLKLFKSNYSYNPDSLSVYSINFH